MKYRNKTPTSCRVFLASAASSSALLLSRCSFSTALYRMKAVKDVRGKLKSKNKNKQKIVCYVAHLQTVNLLLMLKAFLYLLDIFQKLCLHPGTTRGVSLWTKSELDWTCETGQEHTRNFGMKYRLFVSLSSCLSLSLFSLLFSLFTSSTC